MLLLVVFQFDDVKNRMYMDIFSNIIISQKPHSLEIDDLIIHFSKHVANGDMKYFPAVRSLEEFILKYFETFSNDVVRWTKRRKYEIKFRQENNGKSPTSFPSFVPKKKSSGSGRYILDAVDYYNENRLKFDAVQEKKWKLQKKKFEKTRAFTVH